MRRKPLSASWGNGLPRLESWPTSPPSMTFCFRLTPSTNTLMAVASVAPELNTFLSGSGDWWTPGASAVKLMKLRLLCGRLSIWSRLTFTATSDVALSTRWPFTTTVSPCASVPMSSFTLSDWPTWTVTTWNTSLPSAFAVRRYSPGSRPVRMCVPSLRAEARVTSPLLVLVAVTAAPEAEAEARAAGARATAAGEAEATGAVPPAGAAASAAGAGAAGASAAGARPPGASAARGGGGGGVRGRGRRRRSFRGRGRRRRSFRGRGGRGRRLRDAGQLHHDGGGAVLRQGRRRRDERARRQQLARQERSLHSPHLGLIG